MIRRLPDGRCERVGLSDVLARVGLYRADVLALFGTPFLEEIFSGYEAEHPLPRGWRADLPAHSFFALLAHVRLFGRGFLGQTLAAARAVVDRRDELDG